MALSDEVSTYVDSKNIPESDAVTPSIGSIKPQYRNFDRQQIIALKLFAIRRELSQNDFVHIPKYRVNVELNYIAAQEVRASARMTVTMNE